MISNQHKKSLLPKIFRDFSISLLLVTTAPLPASTEQSLRHRDSEASIELTYPDEYERVNSNVNGVVFALRPKSGGFPSANLLRSWARPGSASSDEKELIQRTNEEYSSVGLYVIDSPRIVENQQSGQIPKTVALTYQDPNGEEMLSLVTRWQLMQDRELILTITAPPRMATEAQTLLTSLCSQFRLTSTAEPSSQNESVPKDRYWTNSGALPFAFGVIGFATVFALVWRGISKARSSRTP